MKQNQKNFSLIELLAVVTVIGFIAVVAAPRSLASEISTNEVLAVASLRAISTAQGIYRANTGRFANSGAVLAKAGLIDNELGCATASCAKNGYVFTYTSSVQPTLYFDAVAVPQIYGVSGTGTRSFHTNERGVINHNAGPAAPTADASTRVVTNGSLLYNLFPNKFDFDGDGRSDTTPYRPSNGIWYLQIINYGFYNVQFGSVNDTIVPADYNGDGRTDIAVYRDGIWHIWGGDQNIRFGEPSDVPVPADYDGDGRTDIAVFRPSDGVWYLRQSTAGFAGIYFGQNGDKPVAGDFDGDGKADLAVFRPSNGIWYIRQSSLGVKAVRFGIAEDKLVAADYDGDGKMDVAVYRPSSGTWYLNQSTAGMKGFQFGITSDLPTPADYDGDGKADIAVFREGTWYIQDSATERLRIVQSGTVGDTPAANAFVR